MMIKKGNLPKDSKMRRRILIVNVNWVGDVLFSTPFIKAIRRRFPDAYIACMVVPRCVPMVEGSPDLDEVVLYDEDGIHASPSGKIRFILSLRKKRFDTAYLLHRSFTRTLLSLLAGIHKRIGYYTRKRFLLLTKTVEPPTEEVHKIDYFLKIAQAEGIKADDKHYEFFISEEDGRYAQELLSNKGILPDEKFVVLNPGGNWDLKRWPKENFASVADGLIKKLGYKVIITGAAKDLSLANSIVSLCENKPIILCGVTTLKQVGAVMKKASLVISGDSGPMHISAAIGTPTIAIFGPTSPDITGPRGKGPLRLLRGKIECEVPCYNLTCTDNRCMSAIKPADVLIAAEELLKDA
ncbi:MAG: lipopolysaccharide heptosyltransferase II [Candidatus Omnitrophica bacterium]|nr:lipopolysaccharide heptosyltransferase II [Candidatus Omnitrophota bacterium]